jgi:RimJ/RimL family protein N-acetyltransferase
MPTGCKELQKATASEPLTLPEEYAMQRSWRNDADKLTFIICLAPDDMGAKQLPGIDLKSSTSKLEAGRLDSPSTMIGDVNLFFYPYEGEVDDGYEGAQAGDHKGNQGLQKIIGEIEIMIARKADQGKGLGKAALLTFLWYIISNIESLMEEYHACLGGPKAGSYLEYLRVKIDGDNTRSIKLFEGMGFKKVSEKPNYFGELELRWSIPAGYTVGSKGGLGVAPIVITYS